jgi:hypothetical protein
MLRHIPSRKTGNFLIISTRKRQREETIVFRLLTFVSVFVFVIVCSTAKSINNGNQTDDTNEKQQKAIINRSLTKTKSLTLTTVFKGLFPPSPSKPTIFTAPRPTSSTIFTAPRPKPPTTITGFLPQQQQQQQPVTIKQEEEIIQPDYLPIRINCGYNMLAC